MSAVVALHLRKEFGRIVAVEDVTFALAPGELVGLVGHNGAGKTTTIKMLTGQFVPTSGAVTIAGVDVAKDPGGARTKLGYVPEDPKLYDYLSAREMLEFVIGVRGGGDLDFGLEIAALGDDAMRLIREYSQGMRRRTALACAMVSKPPVLVLDEALNGLDPPSAARVGDRLRAAADAGSTVLFSTHVLETLERLADRVIMLVDGRVEMDARASDMDAIRERFRRME
jgi:ABC-2 type transport system ATP-binding protein